MAHKSAIIKIKYNAGLNKMETTYYDGETGLQITALDIPAIAGPCTGGSSANIAVFSTTEYNSDALAGAVGCPLGSYYICGSAHNEGLPQGVIKKRIV